MFFKRNDRNFNEPYYNSRAPFNMARQEIPNLIWPDKKDLRKYKLFDMKNTTLIKNENDELMREDFNKFLHKLSQKSDQMYNNEVKISLNEPPICCSTPSPIKRDPQLPNIKTSKKHISESFNNEKNGLSNEHKPIRNYSFVYHQEKNRDYTLPPPSHPGIISNRPSTKSYGKNKDIFKSSSYMLNFHQEELSQYSNHPRGYSRDYYEDSDFPASPPRPRPKEPMPKQYRVYKGLCKSPTIPSYDSHQYGNHKRREYSDFAKKFTQKYKSNLKSSREESHYHYQDQQNINDFSKASNSNDSILVDKLKKMILDLHSNSRSNMSLINPKQIPTLPALYLPITQQQQSQPLLSTISSNSALMIPPQFNQASALVTQPHHSQLHMNSLITPLTNQNQPPSLSASQPVINIYSDQKTNPDWIKSASTNPPTFDASPIIEKLQDLINKLPNGQSLPGSNTNVKNNSTNSSLLNSKLQDMIEQIHKEFVENKINTEKDNGSGKEMSMNDLNMFQNQFMFPPSYANFMQTPMKNLPLVNHQRINNNNLLQQLASQVLYNQQGARMHSMNQQQMASIPLKQHPLQMPYSIPPIHGYRRKPCMRHSSRGTNHNYNRNSLVF
jgi:hypothetical protein